MNIISIVINEQISKYKILHNGIPLKKGYHNGTTQIWSSGNTVTYMVDNDISYQEEVDYGEPCNSPKTFVPSKTDWEFIGWSLNHTPSPNLPTTGIKMDGDPITLYAVFRQPVTLTYYNNSTTAATASGYKYYNCGKTANPAFTITQATKSGWSPRGWSTDTAGNASVTYKRILNTHFTSNTTLYGLYEQTCTLSYNGNGADSGEVASQNGTRYYNSSRATVDATFTIRGNGFSKSGYTFNTWALGSADGTKYAPGSTLTTNSNVTMYALWLADSKVILDTRDNAGGSDRAWYQWKRDGSPNNGWGNMTLEYWDPIRGSSITDGAVSPDGFTGSINVADYNYVTLRIKGSIGPTSQGSTTSYDQYIQVRVTDAVNNTTPWISVVHKYVHGDGSSGQEGIAYNQWYNLEMAVPEVMKQWKTAKIEVRVGGGYNNNGGLWLSKLTVHN